MNRFSLEVFYTTADFHDYLHRKQLTAVHLFYNPIPFLNVVLCRILLRSDGDEVNGDNFLVKLPYLPPCWNGSLPPPCSIFTFWLLLLSSIHPRTELSRAPH